MAKTDIGGVWRTVGGRRIFIKDGEDLETAMKKSGKFENKKENKKEPEGFEDSKIRDEDGNLLELYHGTKSDEDFKEFKYDPNVQSGDDFGEAYYFTDDYDTAKGYTYSSNKDERVKQFEKESKELWNKVVSSKTPEERIKNWEKYNNYKYDGKTLPQLMEDKEYWTGGSVKKVNLNVKKPLIVDAQGKNYHEIYPENFKKAKENNNDGIIFKNVTDNARGKAKKVTTYIVFKNNQIEIIGNDKIRKTSKK